MESVLTAQADTTERNSRKSANESFNQFIATEGLDFGLMPAFSQTDMLLIFTLANIHIPEMFHKTKSSPVQPRHMCFYINGAASLRPSKLLVKCGIDGQNKIVFWLPLDSKFGKAFSRELCLHVDFAREVCSVQLIVFEKVNLHV